MSTDRQMPKLRNELLQSVEAWTAECAEDFGLSNEVASQLGVYVANHLADNFGGCMISFPKDHPYKIHQRDVEIYEKFNGTNYNALAQQYKIGTRAVYKIIGKMKALYVANRQPDLF